MFRDHLINKISSSPFSDPQNPSLTPRPKTELHMAVEFISSRYPSWKAIQLRLKHKIKVKSPPRVNEFKLMQRNLGPGSYSSRLFPVPSPYRFPSAPRFNPSDKLQSVQSLIQKRSPDDLLKGKTILKKNLDLSPHQPHLKLENLKKQSSLRSLSQVVVRKTKETLEKNLKNQKLEKIEKREEKLKKWKAAKLFIQAEKGWTVFFAAVFLAQRLWQVIDKRKKIMSTFVFNSSLLYQVSKSIGRIAKTVKEIRKAKAMKVIKTVFLPIFQRKLKILLNGYRKKILRNIEAGLTCRLIKKIVVFWKRKLNKFNSGLRSLLVIYTSRLETLYYLWDEIQKKFNFYSSKLIFPKDAALKIIRKYLLFKLKSFYLYQRELKENILKLKIENQRRPVFRTFDLTQRRAGTRFSFALRSFQHLRIFSKEDLIPLYLEEEAKLRILPSIQETRTSLISDFSKDSSSRHSKLKNK